MIVADSIAALAARLSEALHTPVELGHGPAEEGPRLAIRLHAMAPVPDIVKMSGRHIADTRAALGWAVQLVLKGEAEGLIAQTRMVEAAAAHIDERPVLSGPGWRADMALEADPAYTRGIGPAVGVRLRVTPA